MHERPELGQAVAGDEVAGEEEGSGEEERQQRRPRDVIGRHGAEEEDEGVGH